ncbi:MAG: beta-1,6-N-acetylglucosaminyltransferase [Xanthobacteraceae bacterium]
MAFSLGFVLLTHDRPQQAARLVKRLNAMFGFPPIAWHHDFSQCPALPAEALTPNVTVVHPHTETAWGKFSLVEAAMRALETLFASDRAPDGFVLLSGADYPVKPAERILRDLSTSPCDAHIGHEPIIYDRYQRPWQETCYDRYCALHVRLWPGGATLKVRHPLLVAPFVPFTDTFRCYAGEFWFCGRRSAAEYLIARHRSRPELGDHYRVRQYPDESYVQTILGNSGLKLSNYNWRYVDWYPPEGPRPKRLTMEDLPKLRKSAAHFARKFDPAVDAEVLDALDAEIM